MEEAKVSDTENVCTIVSLKYPICLERGGCVRGKRERGKENRREMREEMEEVERYAGSERERVTERRERDTYQVEALDNILRGTPFG